jgi:hypothetical protein
MKKFYKTTKVLTQQQKVEKRVIGIYTFLAYGRKWLNGVTAASEVENTYV